MPRPTFIATLFAAVALAAAGCGGDDEPSGQAAVAEPGTTVIETTPEDDATVESPTNGSDAGAFASEGCQKLVELGQEYGKALGAVSGGGDTEGIADAAAAFQDFADQVPDEVRADFQVLADAFSQYAEVLSDVDLTSGQPPDAATLAKLQGLFEGDEANAVQEASDRINAWSNENCAP